MAVGRFELQLLQHYSGGGEVGQLHRPVGERCDCSRKRFDGLLRLRFDWPQPPSRRRGVGDKAGSGTSCGRSTTMQARSRASGGAGSCEN